MQKGAQYGQSLLDLHAPQTSLSLLIFNPIQAIKSDMSQHTWLVGPLDCRNIVTHFCSLPLSLCHFCVLQEAASRLPLEDPHQPVRRPAGAEPALPPRLLALLLLQLRPVHHYGRRYALLPAGLFHMDGPGGRAHVPGAGQGLQYLRAVVHAQVLRRGMG